MNPRRRLLKSVAALGAAAPVAGLAQPATAAAAAAAAGDARVGSQPFPPRFNPMAGNPLQTRADVVAAMRALYLPLLPHYSPGGARVRLDATGARHDVAAADLEGYARPLWGLAPLAAGGGADFIDWDLLRRGLANGCDPAHAEYWGAPGNVNQRLVETAAIGFALALVPHLLWQPQPATAKPLITAFLLQAYTAEQVDTNWLFFRLMVGHGLVAIGAEFDRGLALQYERKIDAHYTADGWYRDGATRRMDYYIPFAFHYYGLIGVGLGAAAGTSPARAALYTQRARSFAPQFERWFADDGAALAFGRSLSYRFACAGFWAAAAFADTPLLPWGRIKGLVLRHLRWWSQQPMAHRDGVLSVGYAYPNVQSGEPYLSAASPYWAFKVFAFMALPERHPFWTTPEEALPARPGTATQVQPGMLVFNPPGDAVALASGQEEPGDWCRGAAEKYCKFAYSARYAFGVETDPQQFGHAGFDNMLAFSADGRQWRIRTGNQAVKIAPGLIYARWQPDDGLVVDTWLLAAAPWHVRVHRVRASRAWRTVEGGFAVADRRRIAPPSSVATGRPAGVVETDADLSAIVDLGSAVARTGRVLNLPPNTNLVHARALVPQLLGQIEAGETVLAAAVLALAQTAGARAAWARLPALPQWGELEAVMRTQGVDVGVFAVPKSA